MSLELKKILYNISALADLGQEVTSADNFNIKIRSVLYVIMGTFVASKGAILFYEKDKDVLTSLAQKGFDGEYPPCLSISPEQIGDLKKNEAYGLGDDIPDMLREYTNELRLAGTEIFVPLWARDEFIGAILLSKKVTSEPYTPEDFELLKIIAHQIAITLNNNALFMDLRVQLEENRKLYEEMRLIYHDTIQAFAAAIDAKDVYTKNHSSRVARYVVAIAGELGWEEDEIEGLYIAGLLHDVGKIILKDEILNKKGALSEPEFEEMRRHSTLSSDIISKIHFPWEKVVKTIRHHHERLDGKGYPDALKDGELEDSEKILILADSFDAMTTDRPYRNRMGLKDALEELKRCLGTQFDGKIMGAFCRVLDREINNKLPKPDILPHLNKDFDPSMITSLLQAVIKELSV